MHIYMHTISVPGSKAKKNKNLRINILALMDIRISLQCDLALYDYLLIILMRILITGIIAIDRTLFLTISGKDFSLL